MLNIVWHLRGSISLDGVRPNVVVLDCVEHLLAKQCKKISERGPEHLAFDDPLWRISSGHNWLAMTIYDRGQFWIEPSSRGRRLRYDLRSLHGMVFCLLAALAAFFLGFNDGGTSGGLKFAAGAFAWLYGMNIILALIRVPLAIRNAVDSA